MLFEIDGQIYEEEEFFEDWNAFHSHHPEVSKEDYEHVVKLTQEV